MAPPRHADGTTRPRRDLARVQLVRDAGTLAQLPVHLYASGMESLDRRPRRGRVVIAETEAVTAATGTRSAPLRLAQAPGMQGAKPKPLR